MSRVETTYAMARPFAAWGRLAANSIAHTTEHLFGAVVAVVLPLIAASLGLSMAQAGALVSARSLMAAAGSMPCGFLADRGRGRHWLVGLCLVLLGMASLGLSLSASFAALAVFMAMSGLGGGGFHPPSLAILSSRYRERRTFAVGVHDSSGNLGEVIGPLAIGFLLTFLDWRSALQVWAVPGLVVGVAYALLGAEAAAPAEGTREYRRVLWNEVLKNRTVLGLVAVSTLRAMGQVALSAFLPLYLSLHLKLGAGATGFYMSVLFFFAGTAPTFAGWISDRFGRNFLIMLFSLASVFAIAAVPFLETGWPLAAAFGAIGLVLWALRPVLITAAMDAAPQSVSGTIVAFIFTANAALSFLAPLAAGLVADARGLPAAVGSIALFPLLAFGLAAVVFARSRGPGAGLRS